MAVNKVALNDDEMDAVSGGSILPYRVQPGDSLDDIARRYHVTTEQLIKWNHIQDPTVLTAGQQLKIKF